MQMPSKKALDKYESNVMEAKPLMVAGQPMELDFYGERSQYKRNRTACKCILRFRIFKLILV